VRLAVLVMAIGSLSGCVSSGPMHFAGLSRTDISLPSAVVVKSGVYTTVCPQQGERYGSYEEAVRLAIASAPGANALINVEFRVVTRGTNKVCAEVTGDAVRI